MAMAELQALIKEANKYKDEIEDMHTKHEHLNIKIWSIHFQIHI